MKIASPLPLRPWTPLANAVLGIALLLSIPAYSQTLEWVGTSNSWISVTNWDPNPTLSLDNYDLLVGNLGTSNYVRFFGGGRDVTFNRTNGFALASTGGGGTYNFRSLTVESTSGSIVFHTEERARDTSLVLQNDLTIAANLQFGAVSSGNFTSMIYDVSVGGLTTLETGGLLQISRIVNLKQSTPGRVFLGDLAMEGGTLQLTAGSGTGGSSTTDENLVYVNSVAGTSGISAGKADTQGALVIEGAGSSTYSGVIENGASNAVVRLVRKGSGSQTLTGDNTYTGNTSILGGTLLLDYTGGDADRISTQSHLALGGGTLGVTGGSHTQAFNNATIASGASALTRPSGSSVINLQTLARELAGTVDIAADGMARTITANDANGILGGYATVGAETWAVSAGNGMTPGDITGLATYATDYGTATGSSNFDASASGTFSSSGIHSLRFNTASAITSTLNSEFQIGSGGILVTENVGNNTTSITGGTSLSSGNGEDLIVHQHNPTGILEIESIIDSSAGLSRSGVGELVLSGQNTYTGQTTVNQGVLRAGVAGAGSSSGAFGNGSSIFLHDRAGVVLDLADFNNTVGKLEGGGTLGGTVDLGSGILTLGHNHTDRAEYFGSIIGTGGLTKTGAGTQVLSGVNTYSGATTIADGILLFDNRNALYNDVAANWSQVTVQDGGVISLAVGEGPEVDDDLFIITGNAGTDPIRRILNDATFDNGSFIGFDTSKAMGLAGGGNVGVRYTLTIGDQDGRSRGVVKMGDRSSIGNVLTFRADNSYSAGTILLGGSLRAGHTSAFGTGDVSVQGDSFALLELQDTVGSARPTYTIANNILYSNTHADSAVQRLVENTVVFNTGTTGTLRSDYAPARQTSAEFLGGSATDDRTLDMRFLPDVGAITDDSLRISDVFVLTGTDTDIFVLQLGVPSLTGPSFLAWNDAGAWVNAIVGNSTLGVDAILGFEGSFADSMALANTDYLGSWGYDVTANNVWAVLDHNSEFSVIPEPSSALLLLLGAGALFLRRRQRKG